MDVYDNEEGSSRTGSYAISGFSLTILFDDGHDLTGTLTEDLLEIKEGRDSLMFKKQ